MIISTLICSIIGGTIGGSIGYGIYYKRNHTTFKIHEVPGEVIDRGERHHTEPRISLNNIGGSTSASYTNNNVDDYYIQVKLDNGDAFTKHGMSFFDRHYVGEKLLVEVKDIYYKNKYYATNYKIIYRKKEDKDGNQTKAQA